MGNTPKIIDFLKINKIDKKDAILEFARQLASEGKNIHHIDLQKFGVNKWDIQVLFGSMRNLRDLVGIPNKIRKANMDEHEFKEHIKQLITNNIENCPSMKKAGTVCQNGCTCWITDKISKDKSGRTKIRYKGKVRMLYRVVFSLFKAPLSDNLDILHLCDNPGCFNPDHLQQGTARENVLQSIERGRFTPATKVRHPRHKIQDPYDFSAILSWVKDNSDISEKNEWLYRINIDGSGYPRICIKGKTYLLHRLILANKIKLPYGSIKIACHRFPETSKFSGETPAKSDVNPDHLYNGTPSTNSNDAKLNHKGYNLSPEQVRFILDRTAKTDFTKIKANQFDIEIAECLGVSVKTVNSVRRGKTYRDWHDMKIPTVLTHKPVIQLSKDNKYIQKYASAVEAAKANNISNTGISQACNGHLKFFGGYIWMFEKDYLKNNN